MAATSGHSQAKVFPAPAHGLKHLVCARDKSLTHRAVLFASLAKGKTVIQFPLLSEDCLATQKAMAACGVRFNKISQHELEVESPGVLAFHSPGGIIDCQNSGTTARLLTGLFAGIPNLNVTLTGDESLKRRPMGRVIKPLRSVGAEIVGDELLPITISGCKLKPGRHQVDKASAQVKSALLLAGMMADGVTEIRLPAGARNHTELLLGKLGAAINVEQEGGEEFIQLRGPFYPAAKNYKIPVDPSSSAFFCVLGLLGAADCRLELSDVLANPTRLGFLEVLQQMAPGAIKLSPVDEQGFIEPVMKVTVQGGTILQPVNVKPEIIPRLVDEVPVLAVCAAFAPGVSRFCGLEELRVKESDRLAKTAELLRVAGVAVEVEGDDLIVQGGQPVRGFTFDPAFDHRLAMAACILARQANSPSVIYQPECVAVSFPDFFSLLDQCK